MNFARDMIGNLTQMFSQYGPIVGLSDTEIATARPNDVILFVYGPDLNREVVTQHDVYHKPALTGTLYPKGAPETLSPRMAALRRWGAGLFLVNDEEHRRQRRLMMPAFHRSRIEGYCRDMVTITQETLDTWKPGQRLNLHEEISQLALRIGAKTLFGEEITGSEADGITPLMKRTMQLIVAPAVLLLPYGIPGLPYHRLLNMVERTDHQIRQIIAHKRARGADDNDVLSMLIHACDEDGTMLTEDQLIEHTSLLFIAGHETSSQALIWTLFLLSQHPRVMADVLDELESKLRGSAPTLAQLNDLPMLENVIKESLRLLPPTPLNARSVAHATTLGGYDLPAGSYVLVSIYHTHRMPEVFTKPNTFDPYRWETIDPGPFAFNPFSAGPRMCLGATFAMTELKIILAMLLQRYRLEFIPGTVVDRTSSLTLGVRRGLPMIVRAQDRNFDRGVGGVKGNIHEMVDLGPFHA